MKNDYENRKEKLKKIRDDLLKFHKALMDWDREVFERENGEVSPGKFLELLLSDENFAWLRTISMVIVRIDEAFDLDDGISDEMLDGFYTEIGDMFDEGSGEYSQFKEKLKMALPNLPKAEELTNEIINLLD